MAIDHFKKHYYQKDRVDWNFNVLFDEQPAVAKMATQYTEIVCHPGLYDPIPPQWLHSTILRVGFVDDYSEEEMLRVAAALEPQLAKFTLPVFNFDSWWLWGGNVVLHISPDDHFSALYDAVVEALRSVVGKDRTTQSPHGSFIAHTSLAYARTHDDEPSLHRQLLAKSIDPASFQAKHVSLLRQWPIGGHYEWDVVKRIAIGQTL